MDNLYNRALRRRRRGEGGFTLIELLVVIAVLAILAAIVIFNVVGVSNRGKSSACATDAQTVQTATDAYYNDHSNTYPTAMSQLTAGGYLHSAPTSLTVTSFNGTIAYTCN